MLVKELQLLRLRARRSNRSAQGASQGSTHRRTCHGPSNDGIVDVILIGEVDGVMALLSIIVASSLILLVRPLPQAWWGVVRLIVAGWVCVGVACAPLDVAVPRSVVGRPVRRPFCVR